MVVESSGHCTYMIELCRVQYLRPIRDIPPPSPCRSTTDVDLDQRTGEPENILSRTCIGKDEVATQLLRSQVTHSKMTAVGLHPACRVSSAKEREAAQPAGASRGVSQSVSCTLLGADVASTPCSIFAQRHAAH
jgi:hypothetical protein